MSTASSNAMWLSDVAAPPTFGKLVAHGVGETVAQLKPLLIGNAVITVVAIGLAVFINVTRGVPANLILIPVALGFLNVLAWVFLGNALLSGPTQTWFYENGVIQKSKDGVQKLGFSDVATISLGRWLGFGSSQGYALILEATPGHIPAKITFREDGPVDGTPPRLGRIGFNKTLEILNLISTYVAARIAGKLNAGQSVQWVPGLTLTPQGILSDRLGVTLNWNQIAGFKINAQSARFEIFAVGTDKPIGSDEGIASNVHACMRFVQLKQLGRI